MKCSLSIDKREAAFSYVTQGVPQGGTQSGTQGVPQDVPQAISSLTSTLTSPPRLNTFLMRS